jgi:hypothetical protein
MDTLIKAKRDAMRDFLVEILISGNRDRSMVGDIKLERAHRFGYIAWDDLNQKIVLTKLGHKALHDE